MRNEEIPIRDAALVPPPSAEQGNTRPFSTDVIIVKPTEREYRTVHWWVGPAAAVGLVASVAYGLFFLWVVATKAAWLPGVFFLTYWALQTVAAVVISRWRGWSLWTSAWMFAFPICTIGLLSLIFRLGAWFLAWGVAMIAAPGCAGVLRRWLGARRDLRREAEDEAARARARSTPPVAGGNSNA